MSLSSIAINHPPPAQSSLTNDTTSHQVLMPSEHNEPEHDVSFPAEDFKRNLNVIATDRNGNERLVPAVGLYDSGSESVNIISGRLARRLKIEPGTPSCPPRGLSRISSKLKMKKVKAIEDIRGVDGARVRHQQGSVFVEWQCLDSSPRLHQHLFFDPKTYRTEHIIIENAVADLIFSRRTWLEEKLTQPSACPMGRRISERPKPSTDEQAAQRAREERARVKKKRDEERQKRIRAGFTGQSGQSASNGGEGESSAAQESEQSTSSGGEGGAAPRNDQPTSSGGEGGAAPESEQSTNSGGEDGSSAAP